MQASPLPTQTASAPQEAFAIVGVTWHGESTASGNLDRAVASAVFLWPARKIALSAV